MEDLTFGDKVDVYFSELGRWKVWRAIFVGQLLSLLLSGKCVMSTFLQSATWQFPTTCQLVLPYVILFIIFMPILLCKGIKKSCTRPPWTYMFTALIDVEASFLGVGVALVGGAWGGQRVGLSHVSGATLGLMSVVCIVWADVEGAPTDGKNQLVGDMLCLGGSLLFAVVTVIEEILLKKKTCVEYLAMLGLYGTIISSIQTFVLEYGEIMAFKWDNTEILMQFGLFCIIQISFQMLMTVMLRDAGSVALHLSLVSADYYTLIAGMYLFDFKFHGLYFLSYFLAMVGIFLFCSKKLTPTPVAEEQEPCVEELPQLINDSLNTQDNISMEFTVPNLDCIPIEAMEPPMSRDTTFTSFLGGPHSTMTNGMINSSISNASNDYGNDTC